MATIFLSYAHEDFDTAEQLYFALSNLNHKVFFDKESLQVGEEYNFNIIDSIRQSDFSILLLSPEFFSEKSFCKTELKIIQSNWPVPKNKIFPVMARETLFDELPNYIKSVSILKIEGNLIAEVVQRIQDRLLDFSPSDSVTHKFRKLEIENQLAIVDEEWNKTKKPYMLAQEFVPTKEKAFGLFILFIFIGLLGYLGGKEIGIITLSISGFFGLLMFFAIFSNAKNYEASEKIYLTKKNEITKELPIDKSDI
nr:toll/interleukin-1 receptor domain-containing protein [Bacteroidota bacterium]